jgi:hypothetical protein
MATPTKTAKKTQSAIDGRYSWFSNLFSTEDQQLARARKKGEDRTKNFPSITEDLPIAVDRFNSHTFSVFHH